MNIVENIKMLMHAANEVNEEILEISSSFNKGYSFFEQTQNIFFDFSDKISSKLSENEMEELVSLSKAFIELNKIYIENINTLNALQYKQILRVETSIEMYKKITNQN